ncbi:sugar ABC transporter substrate-binding protein [Sesbania bispinosa]|nr:sugar ABC transporter substrate-binding protein [Sesbania bispinosa]
MANQNPKFEPPNPRVRNTMLTLNNTRSERYITCTNLKTLIASRNPKSSELGITQEITELNKIEQREKE